MKARVNIDEYDTARECENEIVGARDQAANEKAFDACVPDSEPVENLLHMFLVYSQNHPESWNHVARFGVITAWSLAWPCRR